MEYKFFSNFSYMGGLPGIKIAKEEEKKSLIKKKLVQVLQFSITTDNQTKAHQPKMYAICTWKVT